MNHANENNEPGAVVSNEQRTLGNTPLRNPVVVPYQLAEEQCRVVAIETLKQAIDVNANNDEGLRDLKALLHEALAEIKKHQDNNYFRNHAA